MSINSLVVSIPTPGDPTEASGTPTGTVFNTDGGALGGFQVSGVDKNGNAITAPAIFLFATEDGTIVGWNPSVNPKGFDPAKAGTYGIIAVDNSGNNFTKPDPNQQTGAVYKGLAIETSTTPIIASDANSTALLYASNFRAGTIDVYDAAFNKVTSLPASAFADPNLPKATPRSTCRSSTANYTSPTLSRTQRSTTMRQGRTEASWTCSTWTARRAWPAVRCA